ncbi:MAG: S8 family peptidase [Elusimicrobiota bacterium]
MKRMLATSLLLAFSLNAWAGQSAKPAGNSKIMTFSPDVSADARREIVRKAGGRVVRELPLIDGVEAEFPAFTLMSDVSLKAKREVASVEPNAYRNWLAAGPAALQSVVIPSAQQVLRQAMQNKASAPAIGEAEAKAEAADPRIPWGVARVRASSAWSRTMGAGVKVAVVDTGIDYAHPALSGNYKGGYNAVDPQADPKDDHGHGTHVAGTIAAAGEDILGVAPQASLYAVKVLDGSGGGTIAGIIDGLDWCVKNKLHIVNMSLGGPHSDALQKAVEKTVAAGVTIVAAAGNDPEAEVSAPARYPQTIAVSASTSEDGLAYFSTTGPEVDFIAPGHQVPSTWPGGGTKSLSGTSMATPHVTGLAVLAYALGATSPDRVRTTLNGAAAPLGGLNAEQQGGGMIQADHFGR